MIHDMNRYVTDSLSAVRCMPTPTNPPRPFSRLGWVGVPPCRADNVGRSIRNRLEARIWFASTNGIADGEDDEQTEHDGNRFHGNPPLRLFIRLAAERPGSVALGPGEPL